MLARSERFELPTLGFEVRCSIQLSYERASLFNGLAGRLNPLGKGPPKTFSVFSITRLGRRGLGDLALVVKVKFQLFDELGEPLPREGIGRLHSQPTGLLQPPLQFSTVRARHLSAPANWTARTAKMFTDFYGSR
jgi:hypothetical protein